eukprot:CAMPEP_0170200902 /NCGR_PEP_ID=MMETSP0040_2-20121228/70107_1 /TAXON_ID=641309 /ORGANISM="Lotharella oceanica, Strain CCMP622" /LENGTH=66 /DNA_ID=CAMNT_0010451097 /DNA_START=393 /DNA_END=593 /DNA_ORIENTATION=+
MLRKHVAQNGPVRVVQAPGIFLLEDGQCAEGLQQRVPTLVADAHVAPQLLSSGFHGVQQRPKLLHE